MPGLSGERAKAEWESQQPNLVLLDPALKDVDVLTMCHEVCSKHDALVLMMADAQSVHDEVLCLEAGAEEYGLQLIEDASQAQGARYKGCRRGTLGDIAAFSLYYSKNLGAYGEAGIVTTNDPDLAERVRMLRDHGSRQRYRHELIGVNSRLDELQAAVLRIKLRRLDEWNRLRQKCAMEYTAQFHQLVTMSTERSGSEHIYYTYVIQTDERDALQAALRRQGVQTGIHYPLPLHLQPACAAFACPPGSLPVTEHLASRILSLPMFPELTSEKIDRVCAGIRNHFSGQPKHQE